MVIIGGLALALLITAAIENERLAIGLFIVGAVIVAVLVVVVVSG